LKKLFTRIFRRDSTADVTAAYIVFARPEEQQTHARGHDVVVLHDALRRSANPLQGFMDWLASRGGAGVAGGAENDDDQKESGGEDGALVHATPYPGDCCQAFRSHVMGQVYQRFVTTV
jgi:hypothetical protein